MNTRILSTVFFALAAMLASYGICPAQSTLVFDEEVWDFGNIREADGPVSHTFGFTNSGDNAIAIENVSVSCGCTTPSYSKNAVMPGGRGEVKVTYDPAMRPGYFSKEIYVISNGGANRDKLVIKGDVEPLPRTVEQDYPYLFGEGLRLKTLSVNFRYVGQGSPTKTTLGYANTSGRPMDVTFDIVPDDGTITVEPQQTLCADCRGEFTVTVNVPRGETYGRLMYKVVPVVDGIPQTPGITVSAIATDDFSTARGGAAPEMKLSAAYYNFGSVRRGDRKTQSFTLTNSGTAELIIRKLEPQEGISTDLREGTVIAPGASVTVRATLDTSAARGGTFTKVVSILTNDPTRPMREIRLAASVPAQ
ncbi:MAG: DUF1573 domain-containing protein [Alistipes sp.]|nr:DUF1573 domain-containing protein [Alistipes sp.]